MHQNPLQFISINFRNARLNLSFIMHNHHLHNASKSWSIESHAFQMRTRLLYALTNVRRRRWFTLLANLISFVSCEPGQNLQVLRVLRLLHRCIWLMTVFIYRKFPVCSWKCANYTFVWGSFKWICRYFDEMLNISDGLRHRHFPFCRSAQAFRTCLNYCLSITGNTQKKRVSIRFDFIIDDHFRRIR